LLVALALLAGCEVWPYQKRAEFAPPQSRWPETLPSPTDKHAPPPPVARVHCYRTLAAVDCYEQPRPDRHNQYSGPYPAN
jgi:hypothetical protein